MNHSRHQNCKNEHTEMKYFNNTSKKRILKVKNSPLELQKGFKPISITIADMDKFEENEITKK